MSQSSVIGPLLVSIYISPLDKIHRKYGLPTTKVIVSHHIPNNFSNALLFIMHALKVQNINSCRFGSVATELVANDVHLSDTFLQHIFH